MSGRNRCADCQAPISDKAKRCNQCNVAVVHGPADRTPKPCLHKLANHQHGTNAAYVLDKCRCLPCSQARKDQDDWRRRQHAYGRYDKYVDAEPIRAHVRQLMTDGMGLKTVAKRSGVAHGTLSKLMYGVYAPGPAGRNGSGTLLRGPSKRVLRTTADRLLAIKSAQDTPQNLADGALDYWRSDLARTHLRALVAIGWSMRELGRRLEITYASNVCALIHDEDRTMLAVTVNKVEALYAELCMTPPPAETRHQRSAVARARNYAKARGWLPPLALEDVDAVELDEGPDIDEVAIQRRLAGDKNVRLSKAERHELVRIARDRGWSYRDLETRAGISKPERYVDHQEAS